MTAELTIAEWSAELITTIGTCKSMTLRPVARGQGFDDVDEIICTLGGLWSSDDFGSLKPGDDTPLKLTLEADFFEMEMNGTQLFKVDIKSGIRIIGGTDQLAATRAAMGF